MTSNHPARADRSSSSSPYSSTVQTSRLRNHPVLKEFKHQNINDTHDDQLKFGDRLADSIANGIGSWTFIIIQAVLMAVWFIVNTIAFFIYFDSYPFIFLNLAMSAEAAFSAPVIMMSQNRQSEKDRLKADQDYMVNLKAEAEVTLTLEKIEHQNEIIERQNTLILDLVEKLSMQEEREQKMLEKINVLITRTGRNYS